MVLKIHYENYFNLNNVDLVKFNYNQQKHFNLEYLNNLASLPAYQAGMATAQETAVYNRLVEEGQVQGARATKLQSSGDGVPLRIPTSTSHSSSLAGLASSPTFAGNISKVGLDEEAENRVRWM